MLIVAARRVTGWSCPISVPTRGQTCSCGRRSGSRRWVSTRCGCAITWFTNRVRTTIRTLPTSSRSWFCRRSPASRRNSCSGTATLIPHRHPIYAALLLGSLQQFVGEGRLIAGWGLGGHDIDFESIGMGEMGPPQASAEQIEIIRQLWTGEKISHESEFYNFHDVAIRPVPGSGAGIPIWYGGPSKAAVRRAVEFCDGWMASRMPRRDLEERVARMDWLAKEAGRERPMVGAIPYMSPARTVEEGARQLNLKQLCASMVKQFILPPSGTFETVEDIDGAAIAGPPEVIVEQIIKFHAARCRAFRVRPADPVRGVRGAYRTDRLGSAAGSAARKLIILGRW